MKFYLALILCNLVISTYGLTLFGFNFNVREIPIIGGLARIFPHQRDPPPPQPKKQLSPVILVPGIGGSRIDVKLDKIDPIVPPLCARNTDDYFNVWMNQDYLIPGVIECLEAHLQLNYNNKSRRTSNARGVTSRIPGWGKSDAVEWIDPSHSEAGAYFVNLANALTMNRYQRGVSLFGAPYDFRKGPNENGKFAHNFKELIEEVFAKNNGTAVTLIAHGMGGPQALHFLQAQPQAWKAKFIKRLISLNAAWGGSVQPLKIYAVGGRKASQPYADGWVINMERSFPSLAWMMPSPLFWKPNVPLAKTRHRIYTVRNLREFFEDLNFLRGWEMYKDALPYKLNFTAPGVEVHCIYGSNVTTLESLDYADTDDFSGTPVLVTGSGDGAINQRSLEGCKHWISEQKQPVIMKEYRGNDHMGILANLTVLDDIVLLLLHDLD